MKKCPSCKVELKVTDNMVTENRGGAGVPVHRRCSENSYLTREEVAEKILRLLTEEVDSTE